MAGKESIFEVFSGFAQLMARGGWKEAELQIDVALREFNTIWPRVYQEFANKPQEGAIAVKELISAQPQIMGLTLAMARCDGAELFSRFKRYIESILKRTDSLGGYPSVAGVPRVQAGLLYITSVVASLNWESWNLFARLLTTKFEWYYQSGRPLYNYPFDLPYLFHSETFGRDAAKIHDFFREELTQPEVCSITGLDAETTLDTYVQAQMLLCLKAAQLRERGEDVSIWPDFGRFYGERVSKLLERAYHDREFAAGFLRAFEEDADVFFDRLNDRLAFVQSTFWRGAPYFYESLASWEPRVARA